MLHGSSPRWGRAATNATAITADWPEYELRALWLCAIASSGTISHGPVSQVPVSRVRRRPTVENDRRSSAPSGIPRLVGFDLRQLTFLARAPGASSNQSPKDRSPDLPFGAGRFANASNCCLSVGAEPAVRVWEISECLPARMSSRTVRCICSCDEISRHFRYSREPASCGPWPELAWGHGTVLDI